MVGRAARRRVGLAQCLLMASAMGTAVIMLGCGGGGGGGGNGGGGGGELQVCGSAANSTARVVCGNVLDANGATNTPVPGATVTLRANNGTVRATTTTDSNGFFKFTNVATDAALFRVDAPAAGFYSNIAKYNNAVYGYTLTAQAGGQCIPAVGTIPNGDKSLGSVYVYSRNLPPPPYFGCPR